MLHYDDHLQSYAILDPTETEVLDLDKIYSKNLWHLVHMPDGFTYILYVLPTRKLVFPLQLRVTECCVFSYRGI